MAATGMELATAYVSILPSTRGFAPSLSKQLGGAGGVASGAGASLGQKFTAGFKKSIDAIGKAVKVGILTGSAVAVAAGTVGLKTAADMETAQIAFETMLGSGKKAQKFLSQLNDFAAKTPFDLPGLQKSAQSLISIGIDSKKVIPIMTTLGNVTAGMGTGAEGVQRATVAIQQMNAAGKISAEDLNQLRDAGVPVFDLLTAATGKTTAQIADMAGKGKLGKKELTQLMKALESGKGLERFNGMMEKQSKSLSGIWSTLKDTFSVGLAQALEPVLPLIKDGLNASLDVLQSTILPAIKDGLQWLMDNGPTIWADIQDAVDKAKTAFEDSVTWIKDHKNELGLVAGVITTVLLPAMARATWALGVQAAAWVTTKLQAAGAAVGYIASSWQIVFSWVRMGAAAIASGAETAAIWLMYKVESAKAVAVMVATKLKVVASWVAMGAQALIQGARIAAGWVLAMGPIGWIIAAVVAVAAIIWANWDKIKKWTVDMWGKAMAKLEEFRTFIIKKFAEGVVWIHDKVKSIWTNIKNFTYDLWGKITAPLTAFKDFLKGKFADGVNWIKDKASSTWSSMKDTAADKWGKITGAVDGFRSFLKGKFKDAINWIYDSIVKPVWDKIGSKITGVYEKIIKPGLEAFMSLLKGDFPGAFKKAKEMVSNYWDGLKKIASKPVEFVVNTVINKGLIGTFNKIAGKIPGVGKLPEVEWKGFSTGGWTGFGAKHQPAGVVHADEYVLRKEAQQSISRKAPGLLDRLNSYGARALGYATGGLVNPMDPKHRRISAGWHGYPGHLGTDYPAPIGTQVYSPGAGYVANVGTNLPGGTGKQVWIQHTNGLLTRVHHLSAQLVRIGQQVSAGTPVGRVGMTGNTTGPHAHWGVMDGKTYLDPQTVWGTGRGGSGGSGWGWLDGIMNLPSKIGEYFAGKFPEAGQMLQLAKGTGMKLFTDIKDTIMSKIGDIKDAVVDTAVGIGNRARWTPTATNALVRTGNFSLGNLGSLLERMSKESGFNPRAVNNWDSNARRGTPSKGLMQVIQPTFDAYRDRSLSADIFDPLANIVASINYTKARYGSLRKGWDRPGGYADGGLVTPTLYDGGGWLSDTGGPQLIDHRRRKPDAVLTNEQFADLHRLATDAEPSIHIGQIVIPAKDLAELKDITDFFEALRRKARQQ